MKKATRGRLQKFLGELRPPVHDACFNAGAVCPALLLGLSLSRSENRMRVRDVSMRTDPQKRESHPQVTATEAHR